MKTRKKTIALTKLLFIALINMILASVFIFNFEAITTESEKKEELFQKLHSIQSSVITSAADLTDMAVQYGEMFDQELNAFVYADNTVDNFEITENVKKALTNTLDINPSNPDKKDYCSTASNDGTVYAFDNNKDNFVDVTLNAASDSIIRDILSSNDLIIVANEKGVINLYPEHDELEGKNVSALGFKISDLKPEDTVNLNIKGANYYTASSFDKEYGQYFIYGVKSHVFNANNRICAAVICAAMFIVINMIVAYSYFSRQEDDAQSDENNNNILRKRKNPMIIGVIGLLVISVITFHIQSLFSLSVFSMQKNNEKMMIENLIDRHTERFSVATYVSTYSNSEKVDLISALLEDNPQLRTRESLLELKSIFNVPYIHLYNSNMVEIAGTDDYVDQYKDYVNTPIFSKDVDYVIPDDKITELSKEVVREKKEVVKAEDNSTYYVTVGFPLDIFESISKELDIYTILKNIANPGENEVSAINPETMKILYSTIKGYTDTDAQYMGLTPEDMQNNSLNQFSIDGKQYYSSSYRLEDKYVFLMQDADIMFDGRTEMVLATTILSTACIAILLYLLNKYNVTPLRQEIKEEKKMAHVLNNIYTFFDINEHWVSKSAEEKALTIAKTIFHVLSFIVIGIVLFRNSLGNDNTIFGFIVQNKWAKGLNIFSITAVAVVCFIYNFIITIVNFLFRKMFKFVSSKSETYLRLAQSCIIYGTMLALLFYCLYLLGLNPASLLASAGLASFVISLGAKDLITDILAGLFIIFENQFQVGDMIEVGSDLGTVVEIGVRTTRIRTIPGDILCIGNRNLSTVVNKTRLNTNTGIVLSVSYKQNIAAIEDMLREEVPKIVDVLPKKPISGPVYSGMHEFTDKYVKMLVNFTCAESDRFVLTCAINAELVRLFDEHGFQMGIKPIEYKK